MSASDSLYERILADAPHAATPSRVRDSAAVVLWRRRPVPGLEMGELEVYWARRSPQLRFMGGWWAFPGGGVERADSEIEVSGEPAGADARSMQLAPSDLAPGDDAVPTPDRPPPDLVPGLIVCAIRELFEETGVLLAHHDGDLESARRRLLDDSLGFGDLVQEAHLDLTADRLRFAGRWLTPRFAPLRYDNRFFLIEWREGEPVQPTIVPGELDHGEWIAPGAALSRWRSGELLAAPPVLHILRVLDEDGPEDPNDRLRDTREADLGPMRAIDFFPGVFVLPQAVPTLPPATHTNAVLVGTGDAVLVDPAPAPGPEQDRLIAALEAARASRGIRLREIWLTHHHRDHVLAANRVRDHFDVPVAAHGLSREPLAALGVALDRELADGERRVLDGPTPLTLEAMHTPGHTRGHVAIRIEPWNAVLVGDLVSALSTIVIDPPEGDMDAYLGSLARLRDRAPRILIPAHGPLILDAVRRLSWFHAHRLEREAEVAEAWKRGSRAPLDLVDAVYGRLEPMIRPVAARQVAAHLERLRALGTIRDDDPPDPNGSPDNAAGGRLA